MMLVHPGVPNAHCESDHVPEHLRIRDSPVHCVNTPSHPQEESGKRPCVMVSAQRTLGLCLPEDVIDCCLLLTQSLRDLSGNFIATWALERSVRNETASRKFR